MGGDPREAPARSGDRIRRLGRLISAVGIIAAVALGVLGASATAHRDDAAPPTETTATGSRSPEPQQAVPSPPGGSPEATATPTAPQSTRTGGAHAAPTDGRACRQVTPLVNGTAAQDLQTAAPAASANPWSQAATTGGIVVAGLVGISGQALLWKEHLRKAREAAGGDGPDSPVSTRHDGRGPRGQRRRRLSPERTRDRRRRL